jgi:aryl-phospho-beta-D-glucosidase BglC (GH1 family)
VKAAGFNSVRIPVAWFYHSDTVTNKIDPAWLAHVKKTVDYCINDGLYVIINIHWDTGWLENHVTVDDSARVNVKQKAFWTQIAEYFKDYDEHLLFACANEPNDQEKEIGRTVFESYIQTFIKAVRATGGNNSSRTLIFQGHAELTTNIPEDQIEDRLMFEAHYYPYQFSLLGEDMLNPWCGGCGDTLYAFYYWGENNHSLTDTKHNSTYGEEADVDKFIVTNLKTRFVDKGVPVIIGEYGAWKRKNLAAGADWDLHNKSVEYFYEYIVKTALKNGVIPFLWDTGSLLDFNTGEVNDWRIIEAMMRGGEEAFDTTTSFIISTATSKIELYPNPFTTSINLRFDNPNEKGCIELFNIMGKQVETIEFSETENSIAFGANLNPGLYVANIYGENWTKNFRIIKK